MNNFIFTKSLALSIIFSSVNSLTSAHGHSQDPCIKKQNTLGGSGYDSPGDNILKVPGGIVTAGNTYSTDGDFNLAVNRGQDAYLVKYNNAGNIVWKHTYGGSGDDYFIWASSTSDGGFIAIGGTTSNDGDVSGNHGGKDVWLVKLNSIGVIQWQKCYGGSQEDYGWQAIQTNSGYAFVGACNSNDGNLTSNHGGLDGWFVKLSNTGNILYQKSFGGSNDDDFANIINYSNGSCVISGSTQSNNGNVSGYHGGIDTWVLKLSSSNNIVWQRTLGGSGEDAFNGIAQMNDGNIIIGTTCNSNNGDVTDNHGGFDAWIVKLNPNTGNIIWKKSFGDALDQGSYGGIIASDDGGALSFGFDGDFTSNGFTGDDMLVIKMTSNGIEQWKNTFGGSDEDDAVAAVEISPDKYIIAGSVLSNDGDVLNAHGDSDSWYITIDKCGNRELTQGDISNDIKSNTVSCFPNPFSASTTISIKLSQSQKVSINIFDLNGRLVKTIADNIFEPGEHQIQWNAEGENEGIYFLQIESDEISKLEKLVLTN